MSNNLIPPDPGDYGLSSFAELLGNREPIIGETTISFDHFRSALLTVLQPRTAYEAVVADGMIDIEWQLHQQRRMRDAILRDAIRSALIKAVTNREEHAYESRWVQARDAWCDAGNKEEDFKFEEFDTDAAQELGNDLAKRLIDVKVGSKSDAETELTKLGMDALTLMAETYQQQSYELSKFDENIADLEHRRRQVKADLDALVSVRAKHVPVIDA